MCACTCGVGMRMHRLRPSEKKELSGLDLHVHGNIAYQNSPSSANLAKVIGCVS